jgi:outer membrane receptor protein involved in Fe transport
LQQWTTPSTLRSGYQGETYIDLFGSYGFGPGLLDGLQLGFGVENLTGRSPPIFPDSTGATNTDPQQYDVLGRRYFATLNYRF